MIRTVVVLGFALALAPALPADDLESIRKEPSAERRQERALDLMDASFKQAQEAFRQNATAERVQALLDQMAEAAEYSLAVLRETGKRSSKMTKQYKRGDLRTRDTLRKLESFVSAMSVDDRAPAEKSKIRLHVVAEEYLIGVMAKN